MRKAFLVARVFTVMAASFQALHAQDCSSQATSYRAFHQDVGLEPIVLFTEYSPWAMAIGSDTPTFALYKDGTVIYWQGEGRAGKYVTTHLAQDEVNRLTGAARLGELAMDKDCYDLVDFSDAPTNVLVVKTPIGYKSIEIYGPVRAELGLAKSILPIELRTALRAVIDFHADKAVAWEPAFFEVTIWPYDYAPSQKPWPSNFPGLNDPQTRHRKTGLSLYLPKSDLDSYKRFAGSLRAKEAVLIGGKKWAISMRFPFPHETLMVE